MQIFIKIWTKKKLTIDCVWIDIIKNIKEKIENLEGIPFAQQVLIFDGLKLEDNRALSDYNIQYESTLQMIFIVGGDPGTFFKVILKTQNI